MSEAFDSKARRERGVCHNSEPLMGHKVHWLLTWSWEIAGQEFQPKPNFQKCDNFTKIVIFHGHFQENKLTVSGPPSERVNK